jgi:hypothetical protein
MVSGTPGRDSKRESKLTEAFAALFRDAIPKVFSRPAEEPADNLRASFEAALASPAPFA